ncbi:MAG: sulfotransferase [Alphaproteobacteria bacterium]|nr:sulfotransferase [Alphaproteobacteria bacterium]
MILPNVILAGAQKSGTSALAGFIAAHPACAVSRPKEPNFYSRDANLARSDDYGNCFAHVSPEARVVVDATTTYMADLAIAGRIRRHLGADAKIIFILRAPMDRAYSGYLHMLKRGHERRSADEVFLELPDDPSAARLAEGKAVDRAAAVRRVVEGPYRSLYDDVLWNYRYVGNSLYARQVAAYGAVFRPDNILVLIYEEAFKHPDGLRETLGNFLRIDPGGFPHQPRLANQTRLPDLGSPLGVIVEQARWIKRGNWTLVRPRLISSAPRRPSPAVAAKLRTIYRGEVDYWSGRLGRDLRERGW